MRNVCGSGRAWVVVAAIVAGVILGGAVSAEARGDSPLGFVKTDYMLLDEATPRAYFALELGEWRPIHEQRVRRGTTTAWHFYEMMPGARPDDDQPYDYITISMFDTREQVTGEGGTEAIFEVYPGTDLAIMYARADEARSFVRSDLWELTRVVPAAIGAKPVAPFVVISFLEEAPGAAAWEAAQEARIAEGVLQAAALLRLLPDDDDEDGPRPYAYAVVEYLETLHDLRAPGAEAPVPAAAGGTAAVYKSQLWRLIDAVAGVEAVQEGGSVTHP